MVTWPKNSMLLTGRREPSAVILNTRFPKTHMRELGEQDMTSHVNFTGLIRKGEEAGLMLTGFVPQYRFLIGLGIHEEMEAWGGSCPKSMRLKLRSVDKAPD